MSSSQHYSVGPVDRAAVGSSDCFDSRTLPRQVQTMIDIPLPLEFLEPVLPPTCWYCGTTSGPFEHEHQLPLSRGGRHGSNVVRACVACK